jgi:hypothetical protein
MTKMAAKTTASASVLAISLSLSEGISPPSHIMPKLYTAPEKMAMPCLMPAAKRYQ